MLQPYSTRVAVPTGSTVRNVELGLLETVAVNIEMCDIMKMPYLQESFYFTLDVLAW